MLSLGKTLNCDCASLCQGVHVKIGSGELSEERNEMSGGKGDKLQENDNPSRGNRKTPSPIMLQKLGSALAAWATWLRVDYTP